jgi:phosphoribosyl-ATP pyrophosphohydrolase
MSKRTDVLTQLAAVIKDRKENPSGKSYTATLVDGGVRTIGLKILEEADKVVEAAGEAGSEGQHHLIRESADLIYHLLVMLEHRDINFTEAENELAQRFGISGLEEKASRKS